MAERMSAERVAEIEARAKAAFDRADRQHTHATDTFFNACRQDIPDLITYVRELEAWMNELLSDHNHALQAIRDSE